MLYLLALLALAALLFLPYVAWRFFYKTKRPASAPKWVPYYGHRGH
jgi:hypothetical protein